MREWTKLQDIKKDPQEEEEELNEEDFSQEARDLAIEDGNRMRRLQYEKEKIRRFR
jgi:hypothetical protein